MRDQIDAACCASEFEFTTDNNHPERLTFRFVKFSTFYFRYLRKAVFVLELQSAKAEDSLPFSRYADYQYYGLPFVVLFRSDHKIKFPRIYLGTITKIRCRCWQVKQL